MSSTRLKEIKEGFVLEMLIKKVSWFVKNEIFSPGQLDLYKVEKPQKFELASNNFVGGKSEIQWV